MRFVAFAATGVLIGLLSILAIATLTAQYNSWSRDFLPPLSRTTAWQPHRRYPPSVEAALLLLLAVRPEQVVFLRERGIPILFMPPKAMSEAGCSAGDIACTVYATSSIDVPDNSVLPARELAVALSHEIFHVQHHDPMSPHRVRHLWRRLLSGDEESQAHRFGLMTARRLGLGLSNSAIPYLWLDTIEWDWPLGEVVFSAALIFLLFFGLRRLHPIGTSLKMDSSTHALQG